MKRPHTIAIALISSMTLLGCIQAEGDPQLGDTQYTAGYPIASADFAPTTTPPIPGTEAAPTAQGAAGTSAPSTGTAGTSGGAGFGGTGGTGGTPPIAGTSGTLPTAGTGGVGGTSGAAGSSGAVMLPPAASGTLTLSFTTVDLRGQYAPRNIGAVWVETSSGQFVKTIERWAAIRANHLSKWASASGGWASFFGIGGTADEMDAISRATLSRHETHMLTWDMQDPSGTVVPDGSYTIKVELTDNEQNTAVGEIAFEKGPNAQNLSPANQASFTGATLTYTP